MDKKNMVDIDVPPTYNAAECPCMDTIVWISMWISALVRRIEY